MVQGELREREDKEGEGRRSREAGDGTEREDNSVIGKEQEPHDDSKT